MINLTAIIYLKTKHTAEQKYTKAGRKTNEVKTLWFIISDS
jgi:hypothetical protein